MFVYASKAASIREQPDYGNEGIMSLLMVATILQQKKGTLRIFRDVKLLGLIFAFFLCLNISFYYDNNNPSVDPIKENVLQLRETIQNMKWFSTYLPVPVLFIIELLATKRF